MKFQRFGSSRKLDPNVEVVYPVAEENKNGHANNDTDKKLPD